MTGQPAHDMFRVHGGRVGAARALFGGDDWIDLSTGIAPWAFPYRLGQEAFDRLPEPEDIHALESAAAQAFGISDAARVVAVPGTDIAMRLLATLLPARKPAVVQPGYGGHRAAWPDAVAVSGVDDPTLAGRDLLILASPRNPDGRVTPPDALTELASRITVIVDEAYADPHPGLCAQASDRLILLRSFGKYYGLPGLRLGFVIAGLSVTKPLRAMLGDWPVSTAAIQIGTAAYRDRHWRKAQQARMIEAGANLDRMLTRAGLPIVGSAPLFRLIQCDRADHLFETFARHAILTRPFADARDQLRIGLPRDRAAHRRFATALELQDHD